MMLMMLTGLMVLLVHSNDNDDSGHVESPMLIPPIVREIIVM